VDSEIVRDELTRILRDEVKWEGPVPEGPLEQHLDSLQRISLVVAIEDHFHICFEPEDEAAIHDFDDMLHAIAVKVGTPA
jgi:acyl carrier protein